MKFIAAMLGMGMSLVACLAQAQDSSLMTLEDWLHNIPQAESGQLSEINDQAAAHVFSSYRFYALRFQGAAPDPLKDINVFAVSSDGTISQLSDKNQLEAFFTKHLNSLRKDNDARNAIRVWLHLVQSLRPGSQAGFSVLEDSIHITSTDDGSSVSGAAQAAGGGTIKATLTINRSGRVSSAEAN